MSQLPLLALQQRPVGYSGRGYAGMPNPWLKRAQQEALDSLRDDPEAARRRTERIAALIVQLRVARQRAAQATALKTERDALEQEVQTLKEQDVRDLAAQRTLEQQLNDLRQKMRRLEEEQAAEPPSTPVKAGPSSAAPPLTPIPETPDEIKQLERTALEVLTTSLMEDLRKERGILTEEEKLAAVKTQQAQMTEFEKFTNDPSKFKDQTTAERAEMFVSRDLAMALLSDEELARLYRAMFQVYDGQPISDWSEETKLALTQTLLPADASEEARMATLERYATPKFRTAAESLIGLIGTWLNIQGPKKRKEQLDKEAEERRVTAELARQNAAREAEVARLKREEDILNRKVYQAWEETWQRIVDGKFPDDDEEAQALKKRFSRNIYLPLLVSRTPEKAPASYWGTDREGVRLNPDMTEAELRGLLHHLRAAAQASAKIKAFLELVRTKLKKTDATFVLPKFMKDSTPEAGPSSAPAGPPVSADDDPPRRPKLDPALAGGLAGGLAGLKKRGTGPPPGAGDRPKIDPAALLKKGGGLKKTEPPAERPNMLAALGGLQRGAKQLKRVAQPGDQVTKEAEASATSPVVADVTWLAGVQRAVLGTGPR